MTDKILRLNKQLALKLGISRRQADDMIAAGRINVNQKPALLGQRITETDQIFVDGKLLTCAPSYQLIAINKPLGVTCSRRNQAGDKTIYDILPASFHHLKTVGRLDKNSSGLLLLSNDGDFIYQMTHPSFRKIKVYKIRLDHELAPLHQQMIAEFGVTLADGLSKLNLERLSDSNRQEWQVTMSEGRNRQIRRTFAALGYEVTKLHRIQFGPYQLTDLKPGDYTVIK